ncbi:methylesterase 17-like [Hibiscus syriacus]|uniref:Methylesterase 17-like n=1 Tax=Hibiscus syriacus TaxID=106335 RepID=A0A6A2ZLK1_HIBSY|nr:methylesterase 17-like [Hibiscus syriacus]
MNTKTMRLPPRRVSMPTNVKRKERDDFDLKHINRHPPTKSPGSEKTAHPVLSNQLLAGYLAHEFLTRETLFGQPFDPARPQQTDSGRGTGEDAKAGKRSRAEDVEPKPREENHRRYVEVASLLKTDGAHIPGIVNPSQLARLLQM